MKSKFFRLSLNDLIKGAIVTILFSVSSTLLLPGMSFKIVLINSGAVLLSYLAKNIITNSNDEILKPENKK